MPTQKWIIVYYESSSGNVPVYDFVESLSPIAKSKILNTFDLLTEFGIRLSSPHVKKVTGTELWELRILGGDSIRIFYITASGKTFLFLHGFIKKSQKTPKKEIKTALLRLKDHKSRKP